jgi:hypothetical protein
MPGYVIQVCYMYDIRQCRGLGGKHLSFYIQSDFSKDYIVLHFMNKAVNVKESWKWSSTYDDDVFVSGGVVLRIHNLDSRYLWEFGFSPGTLLLYPLYSELDGFQKGCLCRLEKVRITLKAKPRYQCRLAHNPVQCLTKICPSDIFRGSARKNVVRIYRCYKTPSIILNVHPNSAGTLSGVRQYCTVSLRYKSTLCWAVYIYIDIHRVFHDFRT